MKNIELKRVSLNDIIELQLIGKQTFADTFSSNNSEENMQLYLSERFAIEKLKTELSDINSVFYFALLNNKIIGYLKVNFGQAQTEIKDDNALEIERIYVLKEFHGREVGQLLFEKAITISKQRNVDYVWLGVWEENRRAVRFYQKNGFVTFDKHIFRLGNEEQTDLMMKLELN